MDTLRVREETSAPVSAPGVRLFQSTLVTRPAMAYGGAVPF